MNIIPGYGGDAHNGAENDLLPLWSVQLGGKSATLRPLVPPLPPGRRSAVRQKLNSGIN